MSEHSGTPHVPDLEQDVPAGSVESPDDEFDLPHERLDDDFDVGTAREQVREESRHTQG